jgi:uncharacterized protein YneF (UPF0154 family)
VPIIICIVSAVIGYILATKKIKKIIKTKPFLNKKQIREIFMSIGIPLSENNINTMENEFKKAGGQK